MPLDTSKILQILNTALPAAIALYREYRAASPDQPALTDGQIIELLRIDAQDVVDQAKLWLAAHPGGV